jgi:DNA-binding transcriptional LysR family regulator
VREIAKRYPILDGLPWAYRTDSTLAQLGAIRGGAGIGLCQVGLGTASPELVRVLPRAIELSLPTMIAMHEHIRGSPRCRATFDALAAGLRR